MTRVRMRIREAQKHMDPPAGSGFGSATMLPPFLRLRRPKQPQREVTDLLPLSPRAYTWGAGQYQGSLPGEAEICLCQGAEQRAATLRAQRWGHLIRYSSSSSFLGPKWHSPIRLDAISRVPKKSQIPGPNPLPLALVMNMHASKTLCTGLYKS